MGHQLFKAIFKIFLDIYECMIKHPRKILYEIRATYRYKMKFKNDFVKIINNSAIKLGAPVIILMIDWLWIVSESAFLQ